MSVLNKRLLLSGVTFVGGDLIAGVVLTNNLLSKLETFAYIIIFAAYFLEMKDFIFKEFESQIKPTVDFVLYNSINWGLTKIVIYVLTTSFNDAAANNRWMYSFVVLLFIFLLVVQMNVNYENDPALTALHFDNISYNLGFSLVYMLVSYFKEKENLNYIVPLLMFLVFVGVLLIIIKLYNGFIQPSVSGPTAKYFYFFIGFFFNTVGWGISAAFNSIFFAVLNGEYTESMILVFPVLAMILSGVILLNLYTKTTLATYEQQHFTIEEKQYKLTKDDMFSRVFNVNPLSLAIGYSAGDKVFISSKLNANGVFLFITLFAAFYIFHVIRVGIKSETLATIESFIALILMWIINKVIRNFLYELKDANGITKVLAVTMALGIILVLLFIASGFFSTDSVLYERQQHAEMTKKD
jgi:hypothetical protein